MCYNVLMDINTILLILGVGLFLIGFLMRGNTKKSAGVAVVSMLLRTAGALMLLFVISQWVMKTLEGWGFFSDRMI